MNTPAHFPRSNRGLFITALVCLLTIFATTIFVAASGDDSETTRDRAPAPPSVDSATKAKVAERFGRLPLRFESNEGQVDRAVKFLSHGPGYDLFLTANEAVLSLRKPRASEKNSLQPPAAGETREGFVLRLQMIGANAAAQVEGQEQLPGKVNYFAGNDPSQWRRDIPTYRRVYYKGIYPGIDVVYYGNQSELEYDFVVAPGADPKAIKFRVVGADRVRVDNTGDLLLACCQDGERTDSITPAALFRFIEQWGGVIFINETDWNGAKNDDMQGLLNSGLRKTVTTTALNRLATDSGW